MTGHMLGAAGSTELAITALAHVPRRPAADDQPVRARSRSAISTTCPNVARRGVDVRVGLSNGFGFGGHNASLVIERWDENDGRREPEKVTL